MMTLTHPTDLSLYVWDKVSCCSPISSDNAMYVIYHLTGIHGFPPKPGHLGWTDVHQWMNISGIKAVLTRCFIWSLCLWVHLITVVKLNSFSRSKNELAAPTSLCTHPTPTQHCVRVSHWQRRDSRGIMLNAAEHEEGAVTFQCFLSSLILTLNLQLWTKDNAHLVSHRHLHSATGVMVLRICPWKWVSQGISRQ